MRPEEIENAWYHWQLQHWSTCPQCPTRNYCDARNQRHDEYIRDIIAALRGDENVPSD